MIDVERLRLVSPSSLTRPRDVELSCRYVGGDGAVVLTDGGRIHSSGSNGELLHRCHSHCYGPEPSRIPRRLVVVKGFLLHCPADLLTNYRTGWSGPVPADWKSSEILNKTVRDGPIILLWDRST